MPIPREESSKLRDSQCNVPERSTRLGILKNLTCAGVTQGGLKNQGAVVVI